MLLAMRELAYDGLNRRIRKVVSNCGDGLVPGSDDLDSNGTPDATGIPFANRSEHYFLGGVGVSPVNQRILEERDNNGSAGRVLAQTVYGTEYIDEPVCRDRNLDVSTDSTPAADACLDGSGGATGSTRYFYHQDANYRVTAVTSESGTVVERYEYEAYGEPRVHVGQPAGGTYESGALVSTSYVGNPLMHQGLRRDDETGLHENRYRMLHSRLGRFMQRDPVGYSAGPNLYESDSSNAWMRLDPLGLTSALSDWRTWWDFVKFVGDDLITGVASVPRRVASIPGRVGRHVSGVYNNFRNDGSGVVSSGVQTALESLAVLLGGDLALDAYEGETRSGDHLTTEERWTRGLAGVGSFLLPFGFAGNLAKGLLNGAYCFTGDTLIATSDGQRRMDEIEVGDRIDADGCDSPELHSSEWAIIHYSLATQSAELDIRCLRPVAWVMNEKIVPGSYAPVGIEELDIFGSALVVGVDDCLHIESGSGRLVTTTMTQVVADELIAITLERDVLRVTEGHQFYSMDRKSWVRARDLRVGETVAGKDEPSHVQSIARIQGTHRVYNLEVEGAHVYYVAESRVLVHNIAIACRALVRDATGKVHGKLPQFVKKGAMSREELEDAIDELSKSIEKRNAVSRVLGEHGPHRVRISQEEDLLRHLRKRLEDCP